MKIKCSKGYILLVSAALLFLNGIAGYTYSQDVKPQLNIGAGIFTMPEDTGVNSNDLNVFYYRPLGWTPEKPIVIVMHGVKRNAEEYRDEWQSYAEQYNLLVICPEFSEEKYPGVRYYNLGNVADSDKEHGKLQPRNQWIFPVINHVFNEVRTRSGAISNTFTLFGHSAGAQLAHRYLWFSGDPNAAKII